MKKQIVSMLFSGSVLFCIIAYSLYNAHPERVRIYTAINFEIPKNCKTLGIIGCTPHPTQYLKDNPHASFDQISLQEFLDVAYMEDSFYKTFEQCKQQNIDHLLIAYLPIYFVEMKRLKDAHFIKTCRSFFSSIKEEVKELIKKTAKKSNYLGEITLILPAEEQLLKIPAFLENADERIAYLVKQLPSLKNLSSSDLKTVVIINNVECTESEKIIELLKYEYLFERKIEYLSCAIGKERFHKGI
ncbi:MAG TPA: hypothetical protein VHO47_01430 [Candidatus Babeliales bacterium]|nr:hypothetical protein [Candidatus Babeliales bacterium]